MRARYEMLVRSPDLAARHYYTLRYSDSAYSLISFSLRTKYHFLLFRFGAGYAMEYFMTGAQEFETLCESFYSQAHQRTQRPRSEPTLKDSDPIRGQIDQ